MTISFGKYCTFGKHQNKMNVNDFFLQKLSFFSLQLFVSFVSAVPRHYAIQTVKYSRNAIISLAVLIKAGKY